MVLPHSNPGTNAAKCQFITVSDLEFANVYLNFRIATHSCHFQRIQFLFPMMSQIKNWTPMTTLPAIRLLTVHLLDVPGEKSPKNGLWNWEGGSCTLWDQKLWDRPNQIVESAENKNCCWLKNIVVGIWVCVKMGCPAPEFYVLFFWFINPLLFPVKDLPFVSPVSDTLCFEVADKKLVKRMIRRKKGILIYWYKNRWDIRWWQTPPYSEHHRPTWHHLDCVVIKRGHWKYHCKYIVFKLLL